MPRPKKANIKRTAVKPESAEKKIEARVEETKVSTRPVVVERVPQKEQVRTEQKREFDFPYGYGDTRIVLMVRDPHWVHSYWEINESKYNEVRSILGSDFEKSKETLRIYNTSAEPWKSFDISVFYGARSWYINVPESNKTYIVDIGFLAPDGRFIVMARSNAVTTPRDGISDVIDEEWMTIDFDRIYAMSGGFGVGRSSGEIRTLMEKHLEQQKTSGWVSSLSSPFGGPRERPFFLVANTELIVYGATEPTAQLYVQGKKIELRRDGTFTLRFALPDGKQVIPIEAIRDDGLEKRSITPIVQRETK